MNIMRPCGRRASFYCLFMRFHASATIAVLLAITKHNSCNHHLIERICIKLYKSVIQNSYKDSAHARQAPNASRKRRPLKYAGSKYVKQVSRPLADPAFVRAATIRPPKEENNPPSIYTKNLDPIDAYPGKTPDSLLPPRA